MTTVVIGSPLAAHFLRRAGRPVVLVEEKALPPVHEGWVPRQVLEGSVDVRDPWITAPLPQGGTLELWRDMGRTFQSIRRLSARDAERWPQFCKRIAALARLLEELYLAPPEAPTTVGMALKVRRLGRLGMEDLMRILPMSIAELLDDWFESDALKGALGAMGILHLQQGVRSAGTAFRFLHHHVGSPEGVFRPPRVRLEPPLAGVDVRRSEVERIVVHNARVTGVVLMGGEQLPAERVISALDPRRTLIERCDPGWLDPELCRSVSRVRRRGVAALVRFGAPSEAPLVIAPSLDYLERAYDRIKYGEISAEPYLESYPVGEYTEVHFQYAPFDAPRERIEDIARRALAAYLPSIRDAEAMVRTPADLEAQCGWPEGQPYHAELTLDQALWMRPLPQLARYRTPIEGLWLCGPAMHPAIPAVAAYNCVRELLKAS